MAMRVKLDDIEMDATPKQSYSAKVETTHHPVEGKFDPTDHARSKPETWSGTCVISNFPVNQDQINARGSFQSGGSGGYARQTFETIRRMKDDHNTHTLATPLRTYTDMVITDLGVATTAADGDGVVFDIAFEQISIVDASTGQFVTKPVVTNTAKPTTNAKQSKKQGADAPASDRGLITQAAIATGAIKK